MSGFSNKSLYVEFYNYVNQFEFVFLYETFVTENCFKDFENKFLNYEHTYVYSSNENTRQRKS